MNCTVSQNGFKVYSNDEIQCVCIDFDYYGIPKTLEVPYVKYIPFTTMELDYIDFVETPRIKVEQLSTNLTEITNENISERLVSFINDGIGRNNTDALLKYNNSAARFCRSINIPGLGEGYFDFGNLYETIVIMSTLDEIRKIDPTSKDYKYRVSGCKIANVWSSSKYSKDKMWSIGRSHLSVYATDKRMSLLITPSRVVERVVNDEQEDNNGLLKDEISVKKICDLLTTENIKIGYVIEIRDTKIIRYKPEMNIFLVLKPINGIISTIGYIMYTIHNGIARYVDVSELFMSIERKIKDTRNELREATDNTFKSYKESIEKEKYEKMVFNKLKQLENEFNDLLQKHEKM